MGNGARANIFCWINMSEKVRLYSQTIVRMLAAATLFSLSAAIGRRTVHLAHSFFPLQQVKCRENQRIAEPTLLFNAEPC